ncbi:Retinitis pigmentosa 1-like 1 protein [Apodemus speciosus]|uniref:Retinitis pigmentosa 1-like 1 protein n=1 Tax=Apodemus speciosus TaxID=105296 RepID=A0ABQ0FID4_APOSI
MGKGQDKDNASPVSTPRYPRSVQPGSCCPWTPDGDTGSDTLHPVSSASSQSETELESGEGSCLEDTGPRGLRPETQGIERALSDTSVTAESLAESSESGGQLHRDSSQARVMASQGQVTNGDNPCISTQNHLPVNHTGLQTEKYRQGTRCQELRGEAVLRLPLVPGHSGSQDTQRDALPAPARATARRRQRKQKRPAGVVCLPGVSVPYQVAQKGHARQCHYCRDTQSSLDTALQTPMPQEREQACPGSPAPPSLSNSPSAGNQASEDLRSPFSSSLDFQGPQATSKATTMAVSDSDCVSSLCHPSTHSAEPAGDTKCHPSAPTPVRRGEAGCRRDKAGTTPEPFSSSVPLGRWPEAEDPRTSRDCCRFQVVPASPLAVPRSQTQASISEACLAGSGFCPTPPKEQTFSEREPASSSSASSDHSRADGYAGPRWTRLGMSPGIRGSLEEREADGGVTPSALPYTSPDVVVREWLGNIPEKPVLMTYEMAGETTEVPRDGPEGPKKDLGDGCSLKVLGELTQARQQPPEGVTDEHPEAAGVLSGPGSVCYKLGGDLHPDATSGERLKALAEAGIGEGTAVDHGVSLRALPTRVSASTQIMKALLGSKPGRPSSLPEVSSTAAQRLSHSAGALIACLARLHFFDEGLGSLDGKVRLEESSKYQEILNISQTLWPGSELGQGLLDFSLRRLTSHQALLGTEDFTPSSSSGVDVSSGSGGSGESSVPCVMENTLAPEKTDLPLKTPSQRPDSRSQGYPELASHSTVSSGSQVRACDTSGEEAGGGRKQTHDSVPEQSAESTMLEGDAQSEETEGRVRERLQENSVHGEGLPEEGARVCSQEMLAADSQDGAGSPEDARVPKDEAGTDVASAGLWPVDGREEPTESPQDFSESNSRLGEHQRAHIPELGLEEMPRLDARGCKHACTKTSLGARETNTPMAHKGSLDPDPIWVSRLLKKIEKAFMAHLADATAQLRARWNLHDNSLLDQMVTELEQDMGQRLQASTVREVRKIQSRAGRMVPEPPREALRGQTSLQTEQRRRRLQGLRNFSALTGQGLLSLTLEDGPTLGTALGTRSDTGPVEDEFCPCEICLKKKRTPRFPTDATSTVSGAPVRKAFDLQQILQSKKGGSSNREAMEVAPQKTGMMLSQEDPRTVQGADGKQGLRLAQGLGVAEGEEGEGKQKLGGEEEPEILKTEGSGCHAPEEDAATEEDGEICISTAQESQHLEGTEIGKDETLHQSFIDGGPSEAPASQGAYSVEIQEASTEEQPELGSRNQDVKEDSPWVSSGESQGRVGSENTGLDQEGRLPNHRQRPVPRSHRTASSSRTSSLDNCSQVSQKGSEGDSPSGDLKCIKAKNSRVLHAERKVPMMYPESSSSEQEEAASSPMPPKQGKGEGELSAGSLACPRGWGQGRWLWPGRLRFLDIKRWDGNGTERFLHVCIALTPREARIAGDVQGTGQRPKTCRLHWSCRPSIPATQEAKAGGQKVLDLPQAIDQVQNPASITQSGSRNRAQWQNACLACVWLWIQP